MEKAAISVHVHFPDLLGSKEIKVGPDEPVSVLCNQFSNVDFYLHGQILEQQRTFRQSGIATGTRLQTYKRNKPMYELDINFRLPDNNVVKMRVPHVWTFKRGAVELAAQTGLNEESMQFIFAGRYLNMDYAFMNDSCMQTNSTIRVLIPLAG